MTLRAARIGLLSGALVLGLFAGCREAPRSAGAASDAAELGAQPTPEGTLHAYMRFLDLRLKDPDVGLFTPETRRQRIGAGSRDAQQASELRSLRGAIGSMRVRTEGNLAVILFPSERRAMAPYFFRRGDEGWMLDLATARRVLAFDRSNEWSFRTRDHEYAFAFDGG